ncbi:MAG: ATP-binding protein [Oscillospiraceae bacterium]|nr:ATP-binding protein [Oscillospiraceae bacterium]
MKDFIFITGASGIGKTTLAGGLLEHYKTTCIEQHMIPEFISRDGSEPMTGKLEELTCWENQVAMLKCFHRLGYKNIIASDIDDLRTADIPIVFKGTDFITIKLICSDLQQIMEQMRNRPNNGLIDFELQKKMNEKNMSREPLINETEIDVAGKSIEKVLEQAINIIETVPSRLDYEYTKPPKEMFYSWVFANGLR